MKIFISYRRSDTPDVSGRIYDELARHFGNQAVFKDVDDIPLGVNFARYLDDIVQQCSVMLVVIGKDWLNVSDKLGRRRLDQPEDFVQIEVKTALKREIPIVPLLVQEASMPQADELPPDLAPLSMYNGIRIRPDPDFHTDMSRLNRQLERYVGSTKTSPADAGLASRPWMLVLGWALISAAGAALAFPSGVRSASGFLVVWSITGALVGAVQWFLIRQRVPISPWWILATAVAWAVGARIGETFLDDIFGVFVGTAVAIAQWAFLRPRVRGSGWWLVASIVGWIVGRLLALPLLEMVGLDWGGAADLGITGALAGAVSGGALVLLLQRRPAQE